ncbi:MAG: hypothetical protein IPM69_18935 [Ignavibacteria bacterium]|nr:hypothetical protein [Ignavibacteria bacterium]
MRIMFLIILTCLSVFPAFAQHEADNWYFGTYAGFSFKGGVIANLSKGQIDTGEGCATVSDKNTGELLFYTDGVTVWNRKHKIMINGTGLRGGTSSTQSALIIPNPGNILQYYIFTAPDLSHNPGDNVLYYSIVSLETLDGEVISKNNFIMQGVSEKLTGTLDCSGTGYWVVTHHSSKGSFYAFHVLDTGINLTPKVSSYSSEVSNYNFGYIKISPNRSKIALATHYNTSQVSLFDFNAVNGAVTNYMSLEQVLSPFMNDSLSYYGITFSPDNSKLYVTAFWYIYQYDLNLPNAGMIHDSVYIISNNYHHNAALQLGIDGKIYNAHGGQVGVIEKPNLKGQACLYRPNSIPLSGVCRSGLPNFMDYNFGRSTDTTVICKNNSARIGVQPFAGFSYRWTPTTGLNNPYISNPIASPAQTTDYTLNVINKNGCESIQSYVVQISEMPKIAAISQICEGTSIHLSASTGWDTYSWTPTIGLDTATKPNPIAKPKVATRYKVIVTKGGCIDSVFVDVVVNQRPIAKAGEDKITCAEGSRTQLGDTARAGESYLWSPPDGLSDPQIANPTALPKANTKYVVKVWNSTCPDTAYDEVVVTIIDKTQALISNDTSICRGGSVPLLARGGLKYSWIPTTGISDPTIQDPIASPLVTTRYKVLVSIGDCVDSAFVTVSIYSGAHAGADKTVCVGASAELGAQPEAGNTYSWQPSTYLDNPNIANPQCTPQTNMQYILTVISDSGCVASDTVQVMIGTIVAKVSNDTAICSGSSVQLVASGGANYTWTPTTGLSNPNIENPIASPNTTTTYKVKVSSGTCEDSTFVTITVNPQPLANAGQDKTLCIGASTDIGEVAQAGFTYSWQPITGLDDATKANPKASPTSTTQYILTVSGNGGCIASDTVLVTIGTIKAIISDDTSICEGANAKLFASGGAKYEWSPSTGLDNPSIANPTANPTITTRYKVLVSSGTCIDSAFVTVKILPLPNANAGEDKSICVGESTQIGTPADPSNTYIWSPLSGLLSPSASQTTASPANTITYTLQVTNPAGCIKSDEVTVTVNPKNERSFTLQPDTVSILPGKQFTTYLNIPNGITDWSVKLFYDPLLITYNSISEGQAIPEDLKGELLVSGNGGSRSISINFDAFLPHTSDTIYPIKLSVDSSKAATCETWSATGNILMLADYCGKNIRVVSMTGKQYFLTVKDKSIDFGVGLSGNVRLEVFDYVGNSVLVISDGILDAGEYSVALDLPVGVYYCRMRAGLFEQVGKVLVGF